MATAGSAQGAGLESDVADALSAVRPKTTSTLAQHPAVVDNHLIVYSLPAVKLAADLIPVPPE
ncbi:MAG TPA: hypothetical protein VEI74_02035 [Candidatus Methylomirabilis sp.]|nr:hypothetical protein [Candidatus Methylomirabilis sp.]